MIKATIEVDSIDELHQAYNFFAKADYFRILTISNHLDSGFKNIVINFDFDEKLIGEIKLFCGEAPP